MSIIATDILIKSMIEAALMDFRAYPWILDDVFGGLAADALASSEYGFKEVKAAKDWFLKTEIPVLLQWRVSDDPPIPCISVAYAGGGEALDRAALGDEGSIEDYNPQPDIASLVKVYSNFTPKEYKSSTGLVTMPNKLDTSLISPGQFLISTVSGQAYVIKQVCGVRSFKIAIDIIDDFTDSYIAPASSIWNLHRELSFLREKYSIGVHAQNNPGQTIWLWQLLTYAFFRYKEAFLESRGFELSTVSFSPLERNQNFKAENVYSRYLEVEGQVEASWIKYVAPRLEETRGAILIADGPKAPPNTYNDQGWYMEDDADIAQSAVDRTEE